MKFDRTLLILTALIAGYCCPAAAKTPRHEDCLKATDYKGCMNFVGETNSESKRPNYGFFIWDVNPPIDGSQKLYIVHVVSGSPADKAGLKKGDIIESINGITVDLKQIDKLIKSDFTTLSIRNGDSSGASRTVRLEKKPYTRGNDYQAYKKDYDLGIKTIPGLGREMNIEYYIDYVKGNQMILDEKTWKNAYQCPYGKIKFITTSPSECISPEEYKAKMAKSSNMSSQCPPGKKYYERRHGVALFGITLGKGKKTWSGCLTDGEAAAAGAGNPTITPIYTPPAINNQPTTRNCYGTSYGGSFNASCY